MAVDGCRRHRRRDRRRSTRPSSTLALDRAGLADGPSHAGRVRSDDPRGRGADIGDDRRPDQRLQRQHGPPRARRRAAGDRRRAEHRADVELVARRQAGRLRAPAGRRCSTSPSTWPGTAWSPRSPTATSSPSCRGATGGSAPGVPRLRLSGDESRLGAADRHRTAASCSTASGALTGWEVGVARVAVDRDADGRIGALTESVTGRSLQVHWSRTGVVDELVHRRRPGRSLLGVTRTAGSCGATSHAGLRRVPLGRRPADRGRRRRRRRRVRQRVRRRWAGDDADQPVRAGVDVPLRRHRADGVLRRRRRRPGDAPRPVRQPDGDHRRRRLGDAARLRRGAAGRAGRRAGRSDVALPLRRRRPRRARRSRRPVAALGVGRPASPRRDDRPRRRRHPLPVRHRAPGAVAGRRPRRLGRLPDPGRARAAGRDRRRRRCR